jgi:adenylate cyclase
MARPRTLHEYAEAMGIPASEVASAEADGTLGLLIVERTVAGDAGAYTYEELAERSGLGLGARRYWRALGFPEPEPGERAYNDADLEAMQLLGTMLRLELLDDDVALQMARVMGSSMQRVAQSQIDAIEARIDSDELDGRPIGEVGDGEALAIERARMLLPTVPRMLEYTWRRHVQSAARRRMVRDHLANDDGSGQHVRAIGFADLVNFTALSQEVDDATLAVVVDRFESIAYDIVGQHGGRVVKMIGDEVMFEVADPTAAVQIGLGLADAFHRDDMMSDVRVGIALGTALAREGDLFGPTVNLAARLVGIAYAGAVVVSDEVRTALAHDERFRWKALRGRMLKHIGRVQVHTVRWATDTNESMAERARRRRGLLKVKVADLVEKNLPSIASAVGSGLDEEE